MTKSSWNATVSRSELSGCSATARESSRGRRGGNSRVLYQSDLSRVEFIPRWRGISQRENHASRINARNAVGHVRRKWERKFCETHLCTARKLAGQQLALVSSSRDSRTTKFTKTFLSYLYAFLITFYREAKHEPPDMKIVGSNTTKDSRFIL